MDVLDILAMCGGKFGALRIIATFVFSFFMPHLKNLFIFEHIGEIKTKKSNKVDTASDDIQSKKSKAFKAIADRKRMTSTCWDRTFMSF